MVTQSLEEYTTSGSVESSSAIEPLTEVSKDAVSNARPTSQEGETEYFTEGNRSSVGIITRDSDDESLSVSLPSNSEESNKLKQINSFLNTSAADVPVDRNQTVRNSLKNRILRILSTDDEDEDNADESSNNFNEGLTKVDVESK